MKDSRDKTEITKMAAALAFDPTKHSAPQVVAKGMGLVAENILEKAKENQIPVYRDEKLVRQLQALEVNESIPPEMFEIVAEILVFITDLDQKKGKR
ncbi:MAG: EscU/YscU/HrcU family type III secretion system export apparatus switch protein [Bacillota bacterium]|nr:EscU/YscU/HrcU family type III secretion system export apparatus switch protein [Bacillota bacterium]